MTKKTTEEVPSQAIEKVSYSAMEPVKNVQTLRSLLNAKRADIERVLPSHVSADRLLQTFLTAANTTPDLLQCTQSSIIQSVSKAGELGLDVSGTLQEAWILPYNNKVSWTDDRGQKQEKWVRQAQLQIGYRGLAKLARQSGEVATIQASVVYEEEIKQGRFEYEAGENVICRYKPILLGERGPAAGAFCFIRMNSGEKLALWMTTEQIEAVRRQSKQPDSLMWTRFWSEGACKSVFRRLAKWVPLSAEKQKALLSAMAHDDEVSGFNSATRQVPDEQQYSSRTAALAAKLSRKGEDVIDVQPEPSATDQSVRLTPEQITDLKDLARKMQVSIDEIEGEYGAKLEDLEGVTEAEVVDEIKKRRSDG